MHVRPRRSVLYMPGSNARAIEKARTLAADALILDLEDAVAPDAKFLARQQVCDAVRAGGFGRREIFIRINAPDTPWGGEDLAAAAAPMPAWLMTCVAAARAYGLDIVDGVFNDIGDAHGFARECAEARELGFDGKTLVHPSQIEPCNAAFSPTADEVASARKIIAAFDQ